MAEHEIVVQHDRDCVTYRLVCNAGAGSACRRQRVDDIDFFGEPRYVPYDGCIVKENFDIDPSLIPELGAYPGTTFEIGRFPVSVPWDGESWVWERRGGPVGTHEALCYPDPNHPGFWICTEAGHLPQGIHADQSEVMKGARDLLALFDSRRRALGASAETPFEKDLYETLSKFVPEVS